jgi:hypothetical protein
MLAFYLGCLLSIPTLLIFERAVEEYQRNKERREWERAIKRAKHGH